MPYENLIVHCLCISSTRTFIMGYHRFWCAEHDEFHVEFTQHRGRMAEAFSPGIIYDYPIN